MTLAQITIEQLKQAAMRSLEALEGNNLYTSGPWPIDVRPLASPMVVIYYAADGKSYERGMTPELEGDMLNVVLGERREVEALTLWVPVQGDVAPAFTFSGKTTVWSGLIFRAGDYPDKGCSFAEDDLETFVSNFPAAGVPVMSEHADSLLGRAMDRHGARLTRIWRVGGELHGEIKSPSWLDEALDGMRKSVSVGIDFAAKTLREISLTFSPRVADAAVFQQRAALAFSHTPAFTAFAASDPEGAKTIATLAAKAPAPVPKMNPTQAEKLGTIFDGLTPEQRAGRTKDQFLAEFANTSAADKSANPETEARIKALEARNEQLSAQFAADKDAHDGAKFYMDTLQMEGGARFSRATRDLAEFAFRLARNADRATTTFSEGSQGDNEKRLRELVKTMPPLVKFGISISNDDEAAKPQPGDFGFVTDADFPPRPGTGGGN